MCTTDSGVDHLHEKRRAAGTWEARAYLGLPGIEVAAPADLMVFPADPGEDLAILDHPSLILLNGRQVQSL